MEGTAALPRRSLASGHDRSLDADRNRQAVGEAVEHGRAGFRLHDDFFELLGRSVAFDREGNFDALVAVANLVRETEDAAQIDIAFDGRLDFAELDAAG